MIFFSPLCDNEIFIRSFCCLCVPGGGCRGFGVKQPWGQILVRPAPNWGPRDSHLPFWPLFSHPYNGDKRPSLQSTARTVGTQLSASLGASHPRVVATCPASRGNSGRPHVPDASAGRALGAPLPPPRRAPLPAYPGGRRAGIGPAGEPGQRGRAPERGPRARAGRAGARVARSGPCAPRPPRPRLQRGPPRAPAGPGAGPAQRRAGGGGPRGPWRGARAGGAGLPAGRGRRRCGGPAAEWWGAIYWLQFPAPLDGT